MLSLELEEDCLAHARLVQSEIPPQSIKDRRVEVHLTPPLVYLVY